MSSSGFNAADAVDFQSSAQAETNDNNNTPPPSSPPSDFPYFSSLNDDLALSVLAFAADVPFDSDDMNWRASLTQTLPLVSRRVWDLIASTDLLWKAALERRLENESYLWAEGLRKVISDHEMVDLTTRDNNDRSSGVNYIGTDRRSGGDEHDDTASDVSASDEPTGGPSRDGGNTDLIDKACRSLEAGTSLWGAPATLPANVGICQRVYRAVVSRHLRFTSPVFYMRGSARLGQEFGLHFFEPRYRVLISEVMAPFPVSARRGEPIVLDGTRGIRQFPQFLYANHSPLAPTTPACIVDVRQVLIHPNGTADVFLVPTAYVWLERVWDRPNSGGLVDARAVRMGKNASRSLENSVVAAEERRIREQLHGQDVGGSIQAMLHFLSAHGTAAAGEEESSDDDAYENVD